jgi:hypothetical protein
VLAEGLEDNDAQELADKYLKSLKHIQTLLESRPARKQ